MQKTRSINIFITFIFIAFLGIHLGCSPPTDIAEGTAFFVPQEPPSARYAFETQIETEERSVRLDGTGSIVFRNTGKKTISVIAIEWRSGSEDSLHVSLNGQELPRTTSTPIDQRTHSFQLPRTYRPNEEIELDVRFNLETNTLRNGDISLQRWYPKLWWDNIPTRDSFAVKLDIPDGYEAATSGNLDTTTGLYENPGVTTNFGLWLSQNVQVEERDAEGVRVRALFTEEGKECAILCLETAVDVIRFYKEVHGVFPFDSLTIIPGGSRPMGGYPFASALVVIHGQQAFEQRPELHWKWITAHEIGHQYWGEYIMSEEERSNYTESWLMIGMGIFTDRMYVEARKLGDDKHQSFFNRFLGGLKEHFDVTSDAPESLKTSQKYDRNNILIHGKGYSIVSALRSVLGDEVFKTVYLRCIEEYGGKRMSYGDLRKMAEEETGENLKWFFDQWVRSPKYLCYQITSTDSHPEGEGFHTTVTVESLGDSIIMPVEVKAVFKDGSAQTARTELFSKRTTIVFHSDTELEEAKLDPDQRLAMLDKPLPILPKDLPDKLRALPYTGSWDEGLELYKIAIEADIQNYQTWFKLGMVIFQGGYFEESFKCFEKLQSVTAPEDYHFMALTWMGNIRDAQGKRAEAIALYRKALPLAPEGEGWRHDQFGIKSSKDWIDARLKAPFNWKAIIKK
ncbi:M1 family aminopeptidase [Acidobacteriota bacterium]